MRAIDADAVPKEFWEYEFDGKWRGCTIKDLLDSQPTIQPKRGKWKRLDMDTFNCNRCGATFVLNQGGEKMRFCPNCGAKMEVQG